MSATSSLHVRRICPVAAIAICLSLGTVPPVSAQDPGWIDYVLQTLEEINITGGELMYGDAASGPSYFNEFEVRVYDVLGQLISSRPIYVQQPGRHEIGLDFATNASGLYLIALENKVTRKTATAHAILVK